jgi:tetratricopeptide (TPR) repeat protein
MKRIIFTLFLCVFSFSVLFAQNRNVQSAYNYYNNGQYAKAKEAIDLAAQDAKTKDNAKTHFYKGNIYLAIYLSDDEELKTNTPNALSIAYDSYQRAIELDKDIVSPLMTPQAPMIGLYIIGEQYYNQGVELYNSKDYENAMEKFEKTKSINNMFGAKDSIATFNAALCAFFLEDYEKSQKYLKELVNMKYNNASVYTTLGEIYKMEGDSIKAFNTIKMGRERFPENYGLLIAETNWYLAKGEVDKANKLLQEAIDKDPKNPALHFAVGTTYDQLASDTATADELKVQFTTKAEKSYRDALAINPNYFDAYFNLGALFVNQAAAIMAEANQLPIEEAEKYDKLKAQADEYLKKAQPELEKALQVKPEDLNTLVSLKQIYSRTNQYEKLKEVNSRIEKLTTTE